MRNHHVIGAGIGPANISVAALLEPVGIQSLFFDRRPEFRWHSGMLFPGATIQNFYLKDLVTLADPTSPYSFLSFLLKKGRIYRYLNAGMPRVQRAEFEQYYRWVAESLPNLRFGSQIESVESDGENLVVDLGKEKVAARHLVLGTGLEPRIPAFAGPHLGPTVFHSSRFLECCASPAGKRIAIVGGGQSGAEILQYILSDSRRLPEKVFWITRRPNLLPLDDTPFIEEIFTPSYSNYFFALPGAQQERLLDVHRMASDGISADLLQAIYRRLYDLEFNEGAGRPWSLYPESEVEEMSPGPGGWRLGLRELQPGKKGCLDVDTVVLATGLKQQFPAFLEPLRSRLDLQGERFTFNEDFSISLEGERRNKIFVQNAARHCRGLPDPNISLMAWRSAKIVNSLVGRQVYDVSEASSVFDWRRSLGHEPEAKDQAMKSLAGQGH
jgi:lysine N6-hydroxylase